MTNSPRSPASPLLAVSLAAGVLMGCSLFDEDSSEQAPTPTAGATQTLPSGEPVPPTPLPPDPPGTVYDVEWVESASPPLLEGRELESPLADVVPDVEPVWRLYVVESDSEPRPLRESGRLLVTTRWGRESDSLTVQYLTQVEGDGYVRGYERFIVASGETAWDVLSTNNPSFDLSPDGSRFAMRDGTQGRPFNRGAFSVWQPDGETLLLEGFTSERPREWSPDGRYFISTGYAGSVTTPQEQSRNYYLLEPGADEVVLLGRPGPNNGINIGWKVDGSTIAFTEDGGSSLSLFDPVTQELRSIDLGQVLPNSPAPAWSANGGYVAVADGVVDVETEQVLLAPSGSPVRGAAVSPDGSMLVQTEGIFESACEPLQSNRVMLTAVETGVQSILLDCGEEEVFTEVEWLDAGHLLVRSADCDQCEPFYFSVRLFTFPDLSVQNLTDGREIGASYAVAPDRSRVLIGGDSLRVFDAGGVLIREIVPPLGYKVTAVSWSADGSSFAYVVGPARVNLI